MRNGIQRDIEKVFERDEMNLQDVRRNWNAEELLAQEGIFFLKDISTILGIDSTKVKKKAREIIAENQAPWRTMGARKVWNHWIVRMKVFAPYYRNHLQPKVKPIERTWTGNDLVKQKGVFYLTDVCKIIPFSAHQIRHQAKKNKNAKKEYGVWKDNDLNSFVVNMEVFSVWLERLWDGDYSN